jgi:hypothetical protein
MNREELPRIRLKVATNAGINILCTALRSWRVVDWLPHIEEAYREVKEDQEDDEPSKQRFIRALRIKKGEFYIANSELVGDIFEDNDEVQCEITFPPKETSKAKQPKKDKASKKRNIEEVQPEEKPMDEAQKQGEAVEDKPRKRVKKDTAVESSEKQEQQEGKKKEKREKREKKEAKPHDEVKKETKEEKEEKKFQLLKHLDLNHLKSLISTHTSPTPAVAPAVTPTVVEISSSHSDSDS